MADVKFARTQVALPTSGSTNATVTDFGTVKAAIFIVTRAEAVTTDTNSARIGVGFSDGTNSWAVGFTEAHNVGDSNSARGHKSGAVVYMPDVSGSSVSWEQTATFIADGVTLTHVSGTPAVLCEVILIGGDDVDAAVGYKDDLGTVAGDTTVTGLSFQPNVGFFTTAGMSTAQPAVATDGIFSFGCGVERNGVIEEAASTIHSLDDEPITKNAAILIDDGVMVRIYNEAERWSAALKEFTSDGFTVTTDAGGQSCIFGYLALRLGGNSRFTVQSRDFPASGNMDIPAQSEPQFAMMMWNRIGDPIGTIDVSSVYAAGICTYDGTNANGYAVYSQDAQSVSNASSRADTDWRGYNANATTLNWQMDTHTFHPGGFTSGFSTSGSSPSAWLFLVDDGTTESSHKATVTIPASAPDESLTDYPAYVDLSHMTPAFWSTVANGGGDIRVFNSDGTVELPREVVSCDTATDTGELHVKTDLSVFADNQIRIYCDGVSSDYASTDTYGSENVWDSNFALVSHDGLTDSTGNNTLTNDGGVVATGQIGDGLEFDETGSDKVTAGSATAIDDIWSSGGTMSVWARVDSDGEGTYGRFLDKGGASGLGWAFVTNGTNSDKPRFSVDRATTNGQWDMPAITYGSTPQHFSVTYNANSAANDPLMYLDGASQSVTEFTTPAGSVSSDAAHDLWIGNRENGANREFDGVLDEIRLSTTERSAGWIATEYANQNDPFTFYTVSTPKELLTLVATVTIDNTQVTGDHVDFPVALLPDTGSGWATFWSTVANGGADVRLYRGQRTATYDGTSLTGLTQENGTWQASGGLISTTGTAPGSPHYFLIEDNGTGEDATIEVTINFGTDVDFGGIILRYADSVNYFFIGGINSSNLWYARRELADVWGNPTTYSGDHSATIADNTDYTLKVVAAGDDVEVFLDGVSIITFTDSNHSAAKRHGLRAKNTGFDFDNLTITENVADFELPREIVSCDTATDTGEIHALLDVLDGDADTVISVYADGSMADYPVGHHKGQHQVWKDYEAVYHGELDGSNDLIDSTANGYTAAGSGAVDSGNEVSGLMGQAVFVDANEYFTATAAVCNSYSFTLQAWAYKTDITRRILLLGVGDKDVGNYFSSISNQTDTDARGFHHRYGAGGTATSVNHGTEDTINEWIKVDGVFSDNSVTIYRNADAPAADTNTTGDVQDHDEIWIGYTGDTSPGYSDDGNIDEVRVRESALSANWITTEHANQSAPNTFYSVVDPNPPAGGNVPRHPFNYVFTGPFGGPI